MTRFTVDISGDRQVQKLLSDMRGRLHNMRPAMDNIGSSFASRTRLSFVRGQSPWGDSWASLKPSTVAKRRKGSSRPLRDTGRLMNSINHRVTGDSSVEIGSDAIYAGTHQFGAGKGQYGRTRYGVPIPCGTIPARPFFPLRNGGVDLPASWRNELNRIIEQHLSDGRR